MTLDEIDTWGTVSPESILDDLDEAVRRLRSAYDALATIPQIGDLEEPLLDAIIRTADADTLAHKIFKKEVGKQ